MQIDPAHEIPNFLIAQLYVVAGRTVLLFATIDLLFRAVLGSRSDVVNARDELAGEARKEARKPRETSKPPTERPAACAAFLLDALARGPRQVSAVEEAAAKAHVDPQALEQARAELGVVTSRGNAGGVMAVQWSLPG
jgi:hypothetical protein